MTVIDGGGWRVRRPVVVMTVLLGLLFMHGLAMDAAGCMGSAGFDSGSHAELMSMTGAPGADSLMAPTKSGQQRLVVARQGPVAGHGTLCLADQPRIKSSSIGLVSMVVLLAVPMLSEAVRRRESSSRAPPLVSGSALLTRLCIWRT